jgi:hypothetical protein
MIVLTEETDKNCVVSLEQKNNFRTCVGRSKSEHFSGVVRIASMTGQFEDFKSEIVAILAEHVIPFPPQAAVAGGSRGRQSRAAVAGGSRGRQSRAAVAGGSRRRQSRELSYKFLIRRLFMDRGGVQTDQ